MFALKKIIPRRIKNWIRVAMTVTLRLFYYGINYRGKQSGVLYLSDGQNPTFFGYHDKTPFSKDGTKILAMSVAGSDTSPETECSPLTLGYFTKNNSGEFENTFISFAETTTWCWQQGCMLQWHPLYADTLVVYNDIVDGSYGSVIFDVQRRKRVQEYNHPVYSLDPTGNFAATLNFSRLGRLRPGYGYSLLPDHTVEQKAPEDDGLFVFKLSTGERSLLVSLADLAKEAGDSNNQHYINHATFSPDGKRLVFFHLWAADNKPGRGLRVCEADPHTGKWQEVESDRIVSHYCWRDSNVFLATSRAKNGIWYYTLYGLNLKQRSDLSLPFKHDGHPMFHPLDKTRFVTDTYPDKCRDQHLYLADVNSENVQQVAALYSPFKYTGQVRCDLHPRWDREGKFLVVDSVQIGSRVLSMFEMEKFLEEK
jgi:hypothetical protein